MIQDYLEDQLSKTATSDKPTTLHWTGSKTALTELIYALHSQGIFNNANADIKPIVKVFESTFNVDLGDFYHTFLELKSRKMNRTKFLDSLKESLIKKMDEQDLSFTDEQGNDNMKQVIEANYRQVKADVVLIVESEMERIKNDPPDLQHLLNNG